MKVGERFNIKAIAHAKKIASNYLLMAEEDGINEFGIEMMGNIEDDDINDIQNALDVIVSRTRKFITELSFMDKEFARKRKWKGILLK